ncbi:MAG: DUF3570 domain-containing protein [Pseudomonadota bacterium]|nr:DUF3570 domain-containing protein [Pseudomonadota bacterium]
MLLKSLLKSLLKPLAVLSAFAIAGWSHAAAPTADELDSIFAARGIVYQQDDDGGKGGNPTIEEHATIYEGILLFQQRLNDNNAASLKAVGDLVTAASYDDARDKAETVSGATGYNPGRFNFEGRWKHRTESRTGFTLFASYGQEFAYRSTGYGFGLSQSLNEESTQLSVDVQFYDDTVRMIRYDGSKETDEPRDTTSSAFSVTQTLTPVSLINASWVYSEQRGMLATSFNSILLDSGQREFEILPDERIRNTFSVRYKHAIKSDSVQLGASYYKDNWGIIGRALEARYFYHLSDGKLTLEPSYRFYTQSASHYFQQQFQGPRVNPQTDQATRLYQTSDSDLGSFDGHSAGLTLSYLTAGWLTKEPSNYNIGFNVYRRSDELHFYWLTLGWYTKL